MNEDKIMNLRLKPHIYTMVLNRKELRMLYKIFNMIKYIALLFVILFFGCDKKSNEPEGTKLIIFVFEKVNSNQVSIPQVKVSTEGMNYRYTDENGIAVYEEIEPGERDFNFDKEGFQPKTESINIIEGENNEAQVEIVRLQAIDINNLSFTFLGEFGSVGDLGSHSNPALADLDSDGDLDLIVGNADGNLSAFHNIGNRCKYVFEPEPSNFNLDFIPGGNSAPVFTDIDSDGDYDMFVGLGNGTLKGYNNIGTDSYPHWTEDNNLVLGIGDIGSYTQPAFADLDGDSDLDLFIGEKDECRINGFENISSSSNPLWSPNSNFTTNIPVRTTCYSEVHASPSFADLDFDGDLDFAYAWIHTGCTNQWHVWISFFERTKTAGEPDWNYVKSIGLDLWPTRVFRNYPAFCFADLDGDGDSDMIVGNEDGKVYWFENDAY